MKSPKAWYALAGVIAVAVMALGWFLLVAPMRDQAAAMADDTAQVEQSNGQLEVQNARLKVQYEKLPQLKASLAAIRIAIPKNPELPDLLRAVNAVARTCGVTLDAVNPATPTPAGADGVGTVPLQIRASGSYAALTLFVQGLETMPRALLLQQVDVKKEQVGTTAATTGALTMDVTATAFVGADDAPSAATTGAAADPGAASTAGAAQ